LKKLISIGGWLIVLALAFFHTNIAIAEEAGNVGFDVQSILPENQIDKTQSYFDLRMHPEQHQVIQIQVNNTSDQVTTYQVAVNQAFTNDQGFIDYTKKVTPLANKPDVSLAEMAKSPKEITIPAQSTQRVDIALTMPQEEFSGQVLGGIRVVKKLAAAEKKTGIVNQYGYILGLKLTENDQPVKRDIQFISVKPQVTMGKNSVVAQLTNPTMEAMGSLKYDAKVIDRKTKQVVRTVHHDSGMQLAPKSRYNFVMDWQNKKIQSGDYLLNLTIADAKGNQWQFADKFSVTKDEARKINAITINQVSQATIPRVMYLIIGILVVALGLLIWLLIKKRKQPEEPTT
jgi:hypothetical protein